MHEDIKKTLVLSLSLSLIGASGLQLESLAQSARPGASAASTASGTSNSSLTNLDLSSSTASLTSNSSKAVTIQVGGSAHNGTISGGTSLTVLPGQLLTPAQYLATIAAANNHQTLLLSNSGAAVGGYANLSVKSTPNLSELVVPANVSLNAIGFTKSTPLNITGSLNISGAVHALQFAPNLQSVMNLGNLVIEKGGLLTTSLPTGVSLPGVYASSGMQLNVAGNVQNLGTIFSSGTLDILAGGSISNLTSGSIPALISATNLNITAGSGSMVNSGLLQATQTLLLNSARGVDLNINNTNGVIQATGIQNSVSKIISDGTISIGNNQEPELANVTINGGQISSASGTSVYGKNMNISVERIDGVMNNKGSAAHLAVNGGDLVIGAQNISGDPTYFNSNGDITLTDTISVAGDLAFVASGNILTTGKTSIQTTAANNSIFMSAGYLFTTDGPSSGTDSTTTISFTGSLDSTKNISSPTNQLDIKTTGTGTITLISAGKVDLSTGTISTDSGQITILGGSVSATKGSISSTTGNITIAAADAGGIGAITITDGTPSALPTAGTLQNANLSVANITIGSGKALNLTTDGQLTVGKVNSNSSLVNITGGSVLITDTIGSTTDTTSIKSTTGDIASTYSASFGQVLANQITLNSAKGILGTDGSNLPLQVVVSNSIDAKSGTSSYVINDAPTSSIDYAASASSGSIRLQSNGSVRLTSDIKADSVQLNLTNRDNATLDLNAHTIDSTNKSLSISTTNLIFHGGSLNAGTGTVDISSPDPDIAISLGSKTTGGLHLDQTDLNNISAGKLRMGFGMDGGITLSDVSGNLSFLYSVELYQFDSPDTVPIVGFIDASNTKISVTGGFLASTQTGTIKTGLITSTTKTDSVTLMSAGGNIILDGTNGASIPIAHEIKLLAGSIGVGAKSAAIIGLGNAALTITPVRNGNDGGSVYLRGNNLGTTGNVGTSTAPLILDASASGSTGNGGVASFERTATGAFAPTSSSLLLKVSGGSTSGNQGTAVISNNGDLSYDPAAANRSIESSTGDGNGLNITLAAGNIGKGNLLVLAKLDTSAVGSDHNGGNITLESNSTTPLALGVLSTKNGIRGQLLLSKTGAGIDGALTVVNRGGNISNTVQDFTAVSKLVFDTSASATGSVSNTKLLGSSSTDEIRILSSAGAINSTAVTLTTKANGTVFLQTTTGAITANVVTGNIALNSGGNAAATITSNGSGALNMLASSVGGSLTLTHSGGDLNVNEAVASGNTITLKTTKTDAAINLNANLTAGFQFVGIGTINLQTAGNGLISGTGTSNSKTINLTSATGSFGTAIQPLNLKTAQISLNSTGLVNIANGAYNLDALKISAAKSANSFTVKAANSIVLAAALPNVTKASLQSTNGSITLTGSIGSSAASTGDITLVSKGSITGAGTLTNTLGKSIFLTIQDKTATIGSSTVPVNVNGPFISITNDVAASGLININSKNVGTSTFSGLVTTGSVKLVTAGASNYGSNVSGSSVTLNLKGDTHFLGSISASNGAINLTQTGLSSSVVDVAFALSSSTNITMKAAGDLAVHDTINAVGAFSVTAGGAINLGSAVKSVSSGGAITINQTGTAVTSSSFGSLTGQSVTVQLKPTATSVQFLGAITANKGNITITEKGILSNTTVASAMKATGDVTVSTSGTASFNDISAGDSGGNGAIKLTLEDASSMGTLTANGSKGNITVLEKDGKLSVSAANATAAISLTNQFVDGIDVTGALAAISKVTISSAGSVSVAGKSSASSATGTVSITATSFDDLALSAVEATTVSLSGGNIGADSSATNPTQISSTNLSFKSLGAVNFNSIGVAPLTIGATSTANDGTKINAQGNLTVSSPLKTSQVIDLASNADLSLKATSIGGVDTNSITISANNLLGAAVLKTESSSGIVDLKVNANIGSATSSIKVSTNTINISNATGVVNVFNTLATGKSVFQVTTTNSQNLILGSSGPTDYNSLTAGIVTIKAVGASTFNNLQATTGAINITQTGIASQSTFNGTISASKSISINTTGNTTFKANVTASDGGVLLASNSGILQISDNVAINSNGTNSQITLMEKANTSTSGIVIGASVSLSTFASSHVGTKLPLPGQINVVIGTTVPANPVENPTGKPANTIVDIQNPVIALNKVYWGANASKIDTSGAAGSGNEIKLTVIGNSAILFVPGTKAGITIGAKTTLTADPPIGTPAPHLPNAASAKSPLAPATLPAIASTPALASGLATASTPAVAATPNTFNLSTQNNLFIANLSPINIATSQNNELHSPIAVSPTANPLAGSPIEVSPLANSAQPSFQFLPNVTSVAQEKSSRLQGSVSNVDELNTLFSSHQLNDSSKSTRRINSDSDSGLYKQVLENGGRLLAPSQDTVFQTRLAQIEVDAKSLVLIYSNEKALAVFNVDDHHNSAVRVKFGKQSIAVAAGSQLLITDQLHEHFGKLNAIKSASYRKITESRSANLKLISAEFSVPSLLNAISKLRDLINAETTVEGKLGKHLLKTAAALSSVRRHSSSFRQVD